MKTKHKKTSLLYILSLSIVSLFLTIPSLSNATQPENLYPVARVVDGDTIKVDINGKAESVRLIGIDTPETVHPTKPVECFGKEASNKMKELVQDKKVRLEKDALGADRDKYQRLLRYVYLEDGTFVNEVMVKEGYAYAYTSFPFTFLEQFKQDQSEAKENGKGLWADGVCGLSNNEEQRMGLAESTNEAVEADNQEEEVSDESDQVITTKTSVQNKNILWLVAFPIILILVGVSATGVVVYLWRRK
ncbi:thermonuclease family protein [Patescibacteria group bacterium]|nr:thermonuclease family protein [Patescibacteria group bacterium]